MNHLFDILSLGHFILYFFFRVFIKNKYKGVLLLGVLWELFEYIISNNDYIKNIIIENWMIPERYWNDTFQHKIFDIIFNMLGYHFGNLIKPI